MRLSWFAVAALGGMLAGCSHSDQQKAREQAEKAKTEVKKDLHEADKQLTRGGQKLKEQVKKATKDALGKSGERDSGTHN